LYPDHNPADGCGKLSSACEQFFIEEGCFYECDHNLGKWRKHDDCDGGDNGWEIKDMPICMGSGSSEGAPQYGYFAQPDCHTEQGTAGCKRIDEVYTSGFHMCETMWAGSFKYENDTSKDAYVMSFDVGTTNPNNAMFYNKEYPEMCPGDLGAVNLTNAELEGCDANVVAYSHSYLGTAPEGTYKDPNSGAATSASAFGAAAAIAAAAVLLA
jgi:hypothetical protein